MLSELCVGDADAVISIAQFYCVFIRFFSVYVYGCYFFAIF